MSMLSEQRRKTKWVINPTKKPLWSTDSNGIKFGKQLMEKMGWSAGKGLGLKEQGIQEPLRVSFKNDTKGMGFKGNDDDWIEHQDEFNSLLSQLRGGGDDSTDVKDSDVGKKEITSLEEKSKSSKARVHYQKFTRGKDLSKYSENDLACILGTSKTKKEKQKTEEVVEKEPNADGGFETSFGVTTINSGSINDYFKKKWTIGKAKSHNSDEGNNDTSETSVPSISNNESFFSAQEESFKLKEINHEKSRKKHKSRPEKANAEENSKSDSQSSDLENIEKSKERRKKKYESELHTDEPRRKKKKKDTDDTGAHVSDFSCENDILMRDDGISGYENQKDNSVVTKRKKTKNDQMEISNCSSEFVGEENVNESNCQYVPDVENMNETNDVHLKEKSVKKKKKKDKKEAMELLVENNGFKKCDSFELEISEIENTDLTESCLEMDTVKRKKKKKDKEEEFTPKSGNSCVLIQDSSEQDMEAVSANVEGVEEKRKKKDKKKRNKEVKNVDKYTLSDEEVRYNNNLETEIISKVNGLIEEEDVPKPESVKKKKKKKDKKSKLDEIQTEGICTKEINEPCEADNVVEESIKKKKKKKKVKEKDCESPLKEHSESSNKKKKKNKSKENLEQDNKTNVADEIPVTKDLGEQSEGVTANKVDLIERINLDTNNVNAKFNTKTEGEKRFERLRPNLFEDTAAKKYFPEEKKNERVLRLIKWANLSEFRGSNLRDLEGYGRQKLFKKQSR